MCGSLLRLQADSVAFTNKVCLVTLFVLKIESAAQLTCVATDVEGQNNSYAVLWVIKVTQHEAQGICMGLLHNCLSIQRISDAAQPNLNQCQ